MDTLVQEGHAGEVMLSTACFLNHRVRHNLKFLFLLEIDRSFVCTELSTNDEADTGQIIDQMFEEVLEYAEKIEDERVVNDEEHDSGIGACCGGKDKMDMEVEKGKSEEDENLKEDECDEGKLEDNEEELLSFPPSGILSPLSKSVEAVVTPLVRLSSMKSAF